MWAEKIYREHGVLNVVKVMKDEDVDINVLGDTVIQVKYPKNLMKKIARFFNHYKSIHEMNLREITQLAHEQAEIKFIMFKNRTIAKNLTQNYLSLMK